MLAAALQFNCCLQENPGMLTRRLKLEVWHEGQASTSSSSSNGSSLSTPSSSKGTRRRLLTGRMRALGLRAREGAGQGSRDGSSSTQGSASAAGKLHHQQQLHKPAGHIGNGGGSSSSGDVVSHQLPDIPEEEGGDADSAAAAAAGRGSASDEDVSSHMLLDLELEDAAEDVVETEGHQLLQDGSSSSSSGSGGSSTGGVSLGSAVVNLEQLTEAVIQVTLGVKQHAPACASAVCL
jgi:hypothetical protein